MLFLRSMSVSTRTKSVKVNISTAILSVIAFDNISTAILIVIAFDNKFGCDIRIINSVRSFWESKRELEHYVNIG